MRADRVSNASRSAGAEPGLVARTQPASGRRARRRGRGRLAHTVGPRHEQQRVVVAALAAARPRAGNASPRCTTTARSASPSAEATATSVPGSITMLSTSGPTTPSTPPARRRPPSAACVASSAAASVSARARQRVAVASALAQLRLGLAQSLFGRAAHLRRFRHLGRHSKCALRARSARCGRVLFGRLGFRPFRGPSAYSSRATCADCSRTRPSSAPSVRSRCSAWLRSRWAACHSASMVVESVPLLSSATRCLGRVDLGTGRRQRCEVGIDLGELVAHRRRFRDQCFDDTLVGDREQLALQAAESLGDEVRQSARALAQGFGARQQVGDVIVARDRDRALGLEDVVVERPQFGPAAPVPVRRARPAVLGGAPRAPATCRALGPRGAA